MADLGVPAILLAEEIFGQVFRALMQPLKPHPFHTQVTEYVPQVAAGGIAIIASGVIGAMVVGAISNVDELEETFRAQTENSTM